MVFNLLTKPITVPRIEIALFGPSWYIHFRLNNMITSSFQDSEVAPDVLLRSWTWMSIGESLLGPTPTSGWSDLLDTRVSSEEVGIGFTIVD